MKRVCIVGLDGVSYRIVKLLSNTLQLSNIANILCKGMVFSPISIPPYTPIAWTSIFTGVNPGKHSVYGYYNVQRFENGFRAKLNNSYTVKYPRIFEILAMHRLRSVVINVPLTYPVRGIVGHSNMVIVSDWSSPKQFIYPKHYETKFQHYLLTPPHTWWAYMGDEYHKFVSKYSEARINLCLELLEEDFQLFIVIISELDWLLHKYPSILTGRDLDKVYRIALLINKLFKKAKEVCDLIIIVSDHGFETSHYIFNINMLLALEGLTSYKYLPAPSKILKLFSTKSKQNITQKSLKRRSLAKHGLLNHIVRTSTRILEKIIPLHIVNAYNKYIPIHVTTDLDSSKVLMIEYESWSLYIDNEYLDKTINLLKRIGLIRKLLFKHELFWGPYTDIAPDIVIIPRSSVTYGASLQGSIIEQKVSSHHDVNALLILYGDDVCNNSSRANASLFDIVPTALAYMGLPIPHNSDGKILSEVSSINLRDVKKINFIQRFKVIRKMNRVHTRT